MILSVLHVDLISGSFRCKIKCVFDFYFQKLFLAFEIMNVPIKKKVRYFTSCHVLFSTQLSSPLKDRVC